jgi:glycosyltransferase involved in cell wall biosynthesis
MEHKNKKKILYVITKSNFGGAQRYVYELATGLPPEHIEAVVAFGGHGLLQDKLEAAHIRTATIKSFERDINLVKELRSIRELYILIKKERPDVVHLNSSKAGGSGALIARLCGVKNIIFTAHGWPFYEPRNLLWRAVVWFFSYLTTFLVHHVIVVSRHDYEGARMLGLMHKISLIHTALPDITFESKADARATLFPPSVIVAHADDVWLVSTGEHTRNKNLGALINALAHLRELGYENLFLTLMGDGEERAHLEHLVKLHNLESNVYFTGFMPEARTFLNAFDIFLMPSWKEGFPYGLLEAGAAGLTVVASNVGGIPEVIEHENTGRLIDPAKPSMLSDALIALISNPAHMHALGETLRTRVITTFRIETMREHTYMLYLLLHK